MTTRIRSSNLVWAGLLLTFGVITVAQAVGPHTFAARGTAGRRVEVSFPASLRAMPLTGRLIVAFARKAAPEPRLTLYQLRGGLPLFAVDLDQLAPDRSAVVESAALGSIAKTIDDL